MFAAVGFQDATKRVPTDARSNPPDLGRAKFHLGLNPERATVWVPGRDKGRPYRRWVGNVPTDRLQNGLEGRTVTLFQLTRMAIQVPRHVAVIMDGNGRWARQRGWPRSRGHLEGAKSVRECVEGCLDLGIEFLTLFAFSTDNWQRPKEEVDTLMGLLRKFLKDYTEQLGGRGVKLEAIGRLADLPGDCQEQLREAIEATAQNEKLTTILAVNYGGRTEIVDSVKKLIRDVQAGELKPEAIDAELFGRYLYTSKWPDPDLLIRTSGEMRVSNFLLWQVSYTEIFVTKKLWPDFKRQDLFDAVEEFSKRQRRYGAV